MERLSYDTTWFVWRLRGGEHEGGAPSLTLAYEEMRGRMICRGISAGVIFGGQPSDGAKVVMRVDMDGLPEVGCER